MSVTIIPGEEFKRQAKRLAKKYSSLKQDLANLQIELTNNPTLGTDLGYGARKVRMVIKSKGKGKSGGARVITYEVIKTDTETRIVLLTIYDKSEISNISDQFIKSLIQDIVNQNKA